MNYFKLLRKDEESEDYYYDCKLDIHLVEDICYNICYIMKKIDQKEEAASEGNKIQRQN